jgi:hypothetical protein
MVDNGASNSIFNNLSDFIEPPIEKGVIINGYDGSSIKATTRTVKWNIEDESGKIHTITLLGNFFVLTAELTVFSPKHWVQVTNNDLRGTLCTTHGDLMVLKWNKRQYKKSSNIVFWQNEHATVLHWISVYVYFS